MKRLSYKTDPHLSLKLGGALTAAMVTAAVSAGMPEGKSLTALTNWEKTLKTIGSGAALAASVGVAAACFKDESRSVVTACAREISDQMTVTLADSTAAYFRNYPLAWKMGLDVPDRWHEVYALTGGYDEKLPLLMASDRPVVEIAVSAISAGAEPIPEPRLEPKQTVAQETVARLTRPEYQDLADMEFLERIEQSDYSWVDELVTYPTVLVFGAPGSGKTSFARHLIHKRLELGHTVVALDPHNRVGKWSNCKVVGGGRNHRAIAQFISQVETEIINPRYQAYEQGQEDFPPLTVVTEELTNWAINVEGSEKLIEFIPDYRKINVNLLMVAHSNTLGSLGGKAGFKKVLDSSMMQLELLAKPSKDPGKRVEPAMLGWLWGPQLPKSQVEIPILRTEIAETSSQQKFQDLEKEAETVSETPESSSPEASISPESETEITPREAEMFRVLSELGHTQTEIIKAIWNAKPGGTKDYKRALARYGILKLEQEQSLG